MDRKRASLRESGFTILELLVVVAILAALVALALPYYKDYVSDAKITAARTDVMTFSKALGMYDKLEATMHATSTDLTALIGRYLLDFRTFSGQLLPRGPWGNDYLVNVKVGSLLSKGQNGIDDTLATGYANGAKKDDILAIWKPPFRIESVKVINPTTLEVEYSRKISNPGSIFQSRDAGQSIPSPLQVSATVFRYERPGDWNIIPTGVALTVWPNAAEVISEDTTTSVDMAPNSYVFTY